MQSVHFDASSKLEEGWMVGKNKELLFWVPPQSHLGLLWPCNTAIMGVQGARLDMSRFFHGTSWQKCYIN
ncbi:hypothetical protein B0H21DRAFT_700043 [Amylocystis lapponica]|nr:hypothetical protein B0H21DRAFT_700043 [Amylocystis lapponica]